MSDEADSTTVEGTRGELVITASKTTYVVLECIAEEEGWGEVSMQTEASAEAAIRAYEGSAKGGLFVAVPLRSWKPLRFTTETTTRVKIEPA